MAESLASIDWDDVDPPLVQPVPLPDGTGAALVHDPLFEVDRLVVTPGDPPRPAAPGGECAVVIVTAGSVQVDGRCHGPGSTLLVPADAGPAGALTGDGQVLRTLLGPGRSS